MTAAKKLLHDIVIAFVGIISKFLPDKVPVTFIGPQALTELTESIAHAGPDKVLIVTDGVLVEIGLIDRVTEALHAAGLGWSIYSGVEPDPTLDQVEAGYEQLKRDGCQAVLAVGGGSPMDAAKLIAAMATNPGPLSKLEGPMKVKRAPMPLFAVPTTAGTGSEVTIVAVVSDPQTHTKKFFMDAKLLPIMTALDPSLMTGLPAPITAATGMDALTHAVESYLSRTATPTTQQYATTSVRLVFDHLPAACADGGNLGARKAMSLASYYGGLAFTRTSVGYVHAIAHTFGAFYRTPHGLANAIALPHVLEFSKPQAEDRLARLAELIGCEGASDRDKADKFIAAVRGLMSKIDIPDKLDVLEEKDISAIAAQAVGEAHLNYPVPRYMNQVECEALLRRMIA
ncbi:MAG: iron-containing alcohol dehydrogenase [Myxococcota bacterium]|jgi:alcohol dehydrogenase class IV|nr:iron-containing alcohol dehydrogenase [Myxococcota bacterium]